MEEVVDMSFIIARTAIRVKVLQRQTRVSCLGV